jgi:hypothetical protein
MVLEMIVPLSPELISWILSWHSGVEVLEPPELKEILIEYLNEAIKLYKKRS